MEEASSIPGNDASTFWLLKWGRTLPFSIIKEGHPAFGHEQKLFYPSKWRMTILPFAMKDGSSIRGNEERFFHPLEGGWLFRHLKRRRSVPLCLGMKKDYSILRNENGFFSILKWRKVPLVLGRRKASSILWSEGWVFRPSAQNIEFLIFNDFL